MATHCSILAWKNPWTEEPGGLQSKGLQRLRHDLTHVRFLSLDSRLLLYKNTVYAYCLESCNLPLVLAFTCSHCVKMNNEFSIRTFGIQSYHL